MSINRATYYPGRWADATPDQPEGGFKNKSGDAAVDGSYIEKTWANDWAAFFSSVLNGEAANGTPDVVGASQLFDRMIDLIAPVGHVVFTVGDTNPSTQYPGTTWARIAEGRWISSVGQHTDITGETRTLAAGNLNEGTYVHELTIDEMPTHTHALGKDRPVNQGGGGEIFDVWAEAVEDDTGPAGGGAAHNNMPPSYSLYTWQRTA